MRAILNILLAFACTGCAPEPKMVQNPSNTDKAPASFAAASKPFKPTQPTTLSGEWRVAGIDGQELDGPTGLALSGDDHEIWWEPRCAGAVVGYAISGSRFYVAGPPPKSPPPPRGADPQPAAVVCPIGLQPHLPDAMNALRAGEKVRRTPSNGIEISGGGHSITLYSQ